MGKARQQETVTPCISIRLRFIRPDSASFLSGHPCGLAWLFLNPLKWGAGVFEPGRENTPAPHSRGMFFWGGGGANFWRLDMTVTYVRELTLKYRGKKGEIFDAAHSPNHAARLIRQVLPDNVREHFVALLLDSRTQVVGYYVAATGTASSCLVGAREIFQAAVVAGANALVVGHNHPTGDTTPSTEDRAVTQRLKAAGELLGIPILDHLIVGNETFYSLYEHGEL